MNSQSIAAIRASAALSKAHGIDAHVDADVLFHLLNMLDITIAVLQEADVYFQRELVSDNFMGDDEHELWRRVREVLSAHFAHSGREKENGK